MAKSLLARERAMVESQTVFITNCILNQRPSEMECCRHLNSNSYGIYPWSDSEN